jgi:hypothetical protein
MFDGLPGKHPVRTGPEASKSADLESPQLASPEHLLELVWGLEPQTCSLRVESRLHMGRYLVINIVVLRNGLCHNIDISSSPKIDGYAADTTHPVRTEDGADG